MNTPESFIAQMPMPTANRPLLGLTVLVIEDSRYACEAMRLLCLRSGARIRRADCLRSARRHLQVYRPSVVIVDLGLPDGDGLDLIAELSAMENKVSVILGTSGDPDRKTEALAAGADDFFEKPITSLAMFQELVLAALPEDRQPTGPRALTDEEVVPDVIAYQDDISHIADVIEETGDDRVLDYVAQFLSGVARAAQDNRMEEAALALASKRANGEPSASEMAAIAGLIQKRLTQKIAI